MKQIKILSVLVLTLIITACNNGAVQSGEVTRSVPQAVEVTRIVQETVVASQVTEEVVVTTPEAALSNTTEPQPILDTGYYDGIVVITQYYTFLGHNLYEDAYQLLGNSAQSHSPTLDGYVNMAKMSFKKVDIISIQPLNEWKKQQGDLSITPDSQNVKRFFVQIRAWGEGEMSGSVVSGTLQTQFLTVIQENNEWKIDSFATSPAQ